MKEIDAEDSLKPGEHILGMFHHENELDYAFAFLKGGYEKNELILLITEQSSKDEIRRKIGKSWEMNDNQIRESKNDIIIKNTKEILYPNGNFIKNK